MFVFFFGEGGFPFFVFFFLSSVVSSFFLVGRGGVSLCVGVCVCFKMEQRWEGRTDSKGSTGEGGGV